MRRVFRGLRFRCVIVQEYPVVPPVGCTRTMRLVRRGSDSRLLASRVALRRERSALDSTTLLREVAHKMVNLKRLMCNYASPHDTAYSL